jgi:putative FmdB family regulatory protein
MPIYEYRCEACSEQLETMHGINDDALKTCPACGEDQLKRLISSTSFVLKGTGWYQSDYGTKAPSDSSGGDSGGDSSDSSAGDSGGDSSDSSAGDSGGDSGSDSGGSSASSES